MLAARQGLRRSVDDLPHATLLSLAVTENVGTAETGNKAKSIDALPLDRLRTGCEVPFLLIINW